MSVGPNLFIPTPEGGKKASGAVEGVGEIQATTTTGDSSQEGGGNSQPYEQPSDQPPEEKRKPQFTRGKLGKIIDIVKRVSERRQGQRRKQIARYQALDTEENPFALVGSQIDRKI